MLRGAGAVLAAAAARIHDSSLGVARAASTATRTRFGCIYVPHGAVMSKWTPTQVGTGFDIPGHAETARAVFAQRVNVVSGLCLPNAYGQDASAGANHTRSPPPSPVSDRREAGHGLRKRRLGVSADQVGREVHRASDAPLPSLELSIEGWQPDSRHRPVVRLSKHDLPGRQRNPRFCPWRTIRR